MSHQDTIIVLETMLDKARETVVSLEIVIRMLSQFTDMPATKSAELQSVPTKKKRTTAAKRTFGPSNDRSVC